MSLTNVNVVETAAKKPQKSSKSLKVEKTVVKASKCGLIVVALLL